VLRSAKATIFIAGADVGEIADVTDPKLAEGARATATGCSGAWAALPFATSRGSPRLASAAAPNLARLEHGSSLTAPTTEDGLPEVQLGIVPGGAAARACRAGSAGAGARPDPDRQDDPGRRVAIRLADALLPDRIRRARVAFARSKSGRMPDARGRGAVKRA
jgi:hypothetical protein